jgi:hypothetical protein
MIPMLVDSDPAAEPAFGARIFLPRKVRPRVHRTTDAAAPKNEPPRYRSGVTWSALRKNPDDLLLCAVDMSLTHAAAPSVDVRNPSRGPSRADRLSTGPPCVGRVVASS